MKFHGRIRFNFCKMEVPTVTLLKDAFTGEPSKSSRFDVTILKKYSDDSYLIGDDSEQCTLRAPRQNLKYPHLLRVDNINLRIINPKVDFGKKELKIEPTTTVTPFEKQQKEDTNAEMQLTSSKRDPKLLMASILSLFSPMHNIKRKSVAFKILKKLSNRSFIVADSSGHCNFKIDEKRYTYPEEILQEGKCVKINNARVEKSNRTLIFDQESSAGFHGTIKGIESEVCYGCNEVLYGDDALFEHFATSKSCKTTYEGGTGLDTTLRKFFEKSDTNDALRLKVLTKIDDEMFEAADETGICKLKVHPENANRDVINIGKTFAFMKPRCLNSKEKIIQIGKSCHVIMTPNIKIPIKIFNEDLKGPEKEHDNTKPVCEGCNKEFDIDSLLKHIAGKKSCKEKYGNERFETMKKEKRKLTMKKSRKNSHRESWLGEARILYENHKEEEIPESPFDYSFALKCEGCGENFLSPLFLRHVAHNESCKAVYGDRFEAMKKEKQSVVEKMSYKRRKEKRKEQMKDYVKQNAEKITSQRSEKYNDKKVEKLLEAEKSRFEKPVLVWKECRLKDHENFQNISGEGNEQLHQKLEAMKIRVEKFVQEHLERIETTFNDAKGLDEAGAKQKMKELKPFYTGDANGMYIFKTEFIEVDKEFEEITNKLNVKLSCFGCARSDRPPCFNCIKQRFRQRSKEEDEIEKYELSIREYAKKPIQEETSFPINAPMSQKLKGKKSKMNKKSTKEDDSPQIKKKPIIRKRKNINFTMEELDNDIDSEDDFVPTKKSH